MKAISLFCGAGGMDVGFQNAGVQVVWANELDADAAKTYSSNHKKTNLFIGDIRSAKAQLSNAVSDNIDLVFGGPPCQGFSVAGKMDPNDERSKLVWEFISVVSTVKPTIFVMENVKALGELQRWAEIRTKLIDIAKQLGYNCFFKVLNAADFGVPQKRERVFFIGFLNTKKDVDKIFDMEIQKRLKPRKCLRDCLRALPAIGTKGNPLTCTAKISVATSPILRKSPYAGMLFNGMGRPLDLDNQANTLPASMGGNKTPILDEKWLKNPKAKSWIIEYHNGLLEGCKNTDTQTVPAHVRRISIVEAAAIQTFPINYQFMGEKSSVYRQIGNAVPCELAEAVASAVISVHNSIN